LSFGGKSKECQKICHYEFKHAGFNAAQRTGLYAGWELEFRLPKTAAD